ncbi:MAG: hypothetical protein ACKV2V_23850 [Blastocatellia bacterium]
MEVTDACTRIRCVSSPRVSKGCLGDVPFGINKRLAKAALADARATDTMSHPDKNHHNFIFVCLRVFPILAKPFSTGTPD